MATQEPYNPFPRQPPVAVPTPPPASSGNGLAIAGMVVGILGLVAFFVPYVGPILSLVGLVFGVLGVMRAGKVGTGKGMAIAGIACGASGILIGGFVTYLFLSAFKDYRDKAKRSEADLHINRIQKGIRTYWIESEMLPPSSNTLPGLPGVACLESDRKFPELPYAKWDTDPGWQAIDFQAFGDSRYSYRWTKQSETSGIVEAFVDADCDGTISTTTGIITVRDGSVTFELGRPTSD